MKRVFITGISGFAGSHLAEMLLAQGGYEVFGTVYGDGYRAQGVPGNHFFQLDLKEHEKTLAIIDEIKPNWVFHLAALSSPAMSYQDPRGTIINNVEAQINVLDALVEIKEIEKVLVIGSAEEYGPVGDEELPITEHQELRPTSPYAVSKVTQDYLGYQYYVHYNMPIVRVRPFNHTGERQAPTFVVSAFAKQIAEIEALKLKPVVKVGNLEAIRDFTDVKDMMEAYILAMKLGKPGEVYNLGSGHGFKIKDVLTELLGLAKLKIEIESDPSRIQPSDVPKLICDATLFNKLSGWQPKIPFNTTLERVLNYWRKQSQHKI